MKALDVDSFVVGGTAGIVLVMYYFVLNNRKMAYVEKHIFGDKENKNK